MRNPILKLGLGCSKRRYKLYFYVYKFFFVIHTKKTFLSLFQWNWHCKKYHNFAIICKQNHFQINFEWVPLLQLAGEKEVFKKSSALNADFHIWAKIVLIKFMALLWNVIANIKDDIYYTAMVAFLASEKSNYERISLFSKHIWPFLWLFVRDRCHLTKFLLFHKWI